MIWVLYTFADLDFKLCGITKQKFAILEFLNGYGVKVEQTIDGYDLLVTKNNLEYNKTHLKNGSMNGLTKSEVSSLMYTIQRFGRQTW